MIAFPRAVKLNTEGGKAKWNFNSEPMRWQHSLKLLALW